MQISGVHQCHWHGKEYKNLSGNVNDNYNRKFWIEKQLSF